VKLAGDRYTATPTFIVAGSQKVGSWLQIDDFTPPKFASPAEWNIYAPTRFAFQIQVDLIQPAAIIDCE
jgi:hypothetical protein